MLLGQDPPHEIAFGVGRFWAGETVWAQIDATDFETFAEPGFGKIARNLSLRAYGADRSLVTYECRTLATDATARPGFMRCWRPLAPFIRVVMRSQLRVIEAEIAGANPAGARPSVGTRTSRARARPGSVVRHRCVWESPGCSLDPGWRWDRVDTTMGSDRPFSSCSHPRRALSRSPHLPGLVSFGLDPDNHKEDRVIKLRNKHLAALTAIAGLGIGAVATPAVALAASHPGTANVVRTDPRSPDKPGLKDGTSRDTRVDKTSSVDRTRSVDKSPSVDLKTDH